jgi:hypothetical protein
MRRHDLIARLALVREDPSLGADAAHSPGPEPK